MITSYNSGIRQQIVLEFLARLDNSASIPWDWIPEEMMSGTHGAHSNGSQAAQNECARKERCYMLACGWGSDQWNDTRSVIFDFERSLLRCFQLCVILTFGANMLTGTRRCTAGHLLCLQPLRTPHAWRPVCCLGGDNTVLAKWYLSGDLLGKVEVLKLEFVSAGKISGTWRNKSR